MAGLCLWPGGVAKAEAGDKCCVSEMEESCCKAETAEGDRKKDHLQIVASQHGSSVQGMGGKVLKRQEKKKSSIEDR